MGLFIQKISFSEVKNHPTHVDEITVVEIAYNIYKGEYNPGFFRYPAGYMNLLAFIFKIFSIFSDEMTIKGAYKISWCVSKIIIAVLPVMVFIICYFLGTYIIGIIGSFLAIFSGVMIQHSQVAVVDILLSFFCFLFFTISVYWFRRSDISLNKLIVLSSIIGISIAMKYTGAILILSLFFIINRFISQNIEFSGTKYFQIVFTGIVGVGLFLIISLLLANKEFVLQELAVLTTDGIIEIEYHNLLNKLIYLSLFISLGFMVLTYFIQMDKVSGLGKFISPLYLQLLIIVFLGFFLFSPYTILEIKRSFADFMYEYRHMQIGSAAQYHHQSQEYHTIVKNLENLYPLRFYLKLFFYNFGKVGVAMAIIGIFGILKKEKFVEKIILVFLFLMTLTIVSWQNVADRYTLSILPIIYVLIPFGIHWLSIFLENKVLPYHYLFTLLSFLTFLEPLLKWFNAIG